MKRLLLVAVVLGLAVMQGPVDAAPANCTNNPVLVPMPGSFEQVSVSTTAIGFTSSKFAPSGQSPADMAIVNIETAAIRYRDDGAPPTDSVGMVGTAASSLTVCGLDAIRNFQAISDEGATATLDVSYYRGTN